MKDTKATLRVKLGIAVLTLGHIILLIGVMVPLLGGDIALAGTLAVVGEVISLFSMVILGKNGFLTIKAKISGKVKASFDTNISRSRFYVGMSLFLFSMISNYVFIIYTNELLLGTDGILKNVFSISTSQSYSILENIFLVGEVSFIVSIYLLGANWWQALKQMFCYRSLQSISQR